MAIKKQNLDVDFIGGQGALTVLEERALSEYFLKKKMRPANKAAKGKPFATKRKEAAV